MGYEEKKIIFETDSLVAQQTVNQKSVSRMARFVMKYSGGSIKDEKQASYLLLMLVALSIIFSLYLIFVSNKTVIKRGGSGPSEKELREYRLLQPF